MCRISLETVRNIMGRVSSFFNWLVKQGYREDNPFSGVAPKRVHSARSERSPFTDDDLKLLFGTAIYKDKKYTHTIGSIGYPCWVYIQALDSKNYAN